MPYLLSTGELSLNELVDQIAEDAVAVAPALGRVRAGALARTLLAARVSQTEACGLHPACAAGRSVWPGNRPPAGDVQPCAFSDGDPFELPNVFAVSAADVLDLSGTERDCTEERLAAVFRKALAAHLFYNARCGRAPVCAAEVTDPFRSPR